jgi:signal peptidase I
MSSDTEDRPATDPAAGETPASEAPVEAHAAEPADAAAETAGVETFAAAAEPAEPLPEAPAAPEIAPEAAEVAEPEARPDPAPHTAEEPEADAPKAKDEFVEIAKTIIYALLIAFVLRVFLFQPFTIPSASMEPNLYEGDYIIVSKWSYGYSKYSMSIGPWSPPLPSGRLFNTAPKRGDIVVFKLPRDNKTDYIKRVIGLPGDQIQMKNAQLYINGQPVKDAPIGQLKITSAPGVDTATEFNETLPNGKTIHTQVFPQGSQLDNTDVYTVPTGYYFMMGDNRDDSIDSRVPPEYQGVGFVPAENLVGKAQVIMFSWYPGASLWKPWTWFTKLRPSRFFHGLK